MIDRVTFVHCFCVGSIAWFLAAGCETGRDQATSLVELRRVCREEIQDDQVRAVFLAAVGEAESEIAKRNAGSASEVLIGLSHLAYLAKDEISHRAAIGTILAVNSLFERGTFKHEDGRIYPNPRPGYECNGKTGFCDIRNPNSDCYLIYELPDTIHRGCISVIR